MSNYTFDEDETPYAAYDDDDPNNPRHRDHDLSDSFDYDWERPADTKPWYLQRWFVVTISLVLVVSLLMPLVIRLT